MCAKIWEYMISNPTYEVYANNIEDICSKDSLSDSKGLTVILPDNNFMRTFNDNIHGDGLASHAKRMLMNTVIKKFLPDVSDFEEFGGDIPFRSGLTLLIDRVNIDKERIIFNNNCVIERVKDFDCPKGFRYALWKVIEGSWPTEMTFSTKKKGSNRNKIKGGNYINNIGKELNNSSDTHRVRLFSSIMNEYKKYLKNNQTGINPFLIKCVSLYNWLKNYANNTYLKIVTITDICPATTISIFILDPDSDITDEMLFGNQSEKNQVLKIGWNNTIITRDPYKEWQEHLKKASQWSDKKNEYFSSLIKLRNNIICNQKYTPDTISKTITDIYTNYNKYIYQYCDETAIKYLNEMYGEYPEKKKWQDMLRYICSIIFSGYDIHHTRISEYMDNILSFRPLGNDDIYERAARFTYDSRKYMSQEDYYSAFQWLFSTDFLYMPDSLTNEKSLVNKKSKNPYSGQFNNKPNTTSIINCHAINFIILETNKRKEFKQSSEIMYGVQWQLQQTIEDDDIRQEMINKTRLSQDYLKIGGDLFSGGKTKGFSNNTKKSKKKLQRGEYDSDDENDEFKNLANLTFLLSDEDAENFKNVIDTVENTNPCPSNLKPKRNKGGKYESDESDD